MDSDLRDPVLASSRALAFLAGTVLSNHTRDADQSCVSRPHLTSHAFFSFFFKLYFLTHSLASHPIRESITCQSNALPVEQEKR